MQRGVGTSRILCVFFFVSLKETCEDLNCAFNMQMSSCSTKPTFSISRMWLHILIITDFIYCFHIYRKITSCGCCKLSEDNIMMPWILNYLSHALLAKLCCHLQLEATYRKEKGELKWFGSVRSSRKESERMRAPIPLLSPNGAIKRLPLYVGSSHHPLPLLSQSKSPSSFFVYLLCQHLILIHSYIYNNNNYATVFLGEKSSGGSSFFSGIWGKQRKEIKGELMKEKYKIGPLSTLKIREKNHS